MKRKRLKKAPTSHVENLIGSLDEVYWEASWECPVGNMMILAFHPIRRHIMLHKLVRGLR